MEQNQVSDEELLERINKVLNESKEDGRKRIAEVLSSSSSSRQEDNLGEKFHDVYETTEQEGFISNNEEDDNNNNNNNNSSNNNNDNNNNNNNLDGGNEIGSSKNLVLENHYLSLQLKAERKKGKELRAKFKLFENSVKHFERLNGQLENIKRAVDEDLAEPEVEIGRANPEAMQKIRPKTVHTAASGMAADAGAGPDNFGEPPPDDRWSKSKGEDEGEKEEVSFREAEDFIPLDLGSEMVKDKKNAADPEAEKVFITKTEKRCLEDIGNLAARTRTPVDDKHQRFFERDRRKYACRIAMPEIQEVVKAEYVPPEIISKTNETPGNITSADPDGLQSYLFQLKWLIARRETAWARTTERDYNQRVEIVRFKNEVGRLRVLCEKRQRDIKERDQIIAKKEEEIKELQKRIQGLRSAIVKLEKKDERLMDTIDGMTNEVLENSQIVQRSYDAMKRQSMTNRATALSNPGNHVVHVKPTSTIQAKSSSKSKDSICKRPRNPLDKSSSKKGRPHEAIASSEDDWKSFAEKLGKAGSAADRDKEATRTRHKGDFFGHKAQAKHDRVDEKLQRVEEMLHSEVLREARKSIQPGRTGGARSSLDPGRSRGPATKAPAEIPLHSKKLTPSNSTIRQEMLMAMTGLGGNSNFQLRNPGFPDPKKNQAAAAVIANALLSTRNATAFNH